MLHVANNSTLGHLCHGENVANRELRLLAAIDELSGVHALSSREELLLDLKAVGGAELHDGKRGTTSRIVDDLLHHTLDVSVPLRKVIVAEAHGTLAVLSVRGEDRTSTLTLRPDTYTHLALL